MLALLLGLLSFEASGGVQRYGVATLRRRAIARMTAPDFASLTRRELQALAKKAGIRANQKSVEIIAQLQLEASNDAAFSSTDSMDSATSPMRPEAASPDGASLDSTSPDANTAGDAASIDPIVPADVGVDLIERGVPDVLRSARCEAGRWQPLRLEGDEVELTLLVRDTGQPVDTLDVPRLMLLGEELGSLKVVGLPAVSLSAAQVEQSLAWTSVVLGLLGADDESLFPPAAQILHPEGVDAPTASPGAASGDLSSASAAILFMPSEHDLATLETLRDPLQWAEVERVDSLSHAHGPRRPDKEVDEAAWPLDAAGQPLMVLVHHRPLWRPYTSTARLVRGEAGLARIQPSQGLGVYTGKGGASSPKNQLQNLAHRLRRPLPAYTFTQLGEQWWTASVELDGAPAAFEGDESSTKKASSLSAAEKALEWATEHWTESEAVPPVAALTGEGTAMQSAADASNWDPELSRFAARLGGYVTLRVDELGHQLYEAHVSLEGLSDEAWRAGPPALQEAGREGGIVLPGERARSKKAATKGAARRALQVWASWPGWSEEAFGAAGGEEAHRPPLNLAAPLRVAQWRGAACAVVVARLLAHSAEVVTLRANLTRCLPAEVVPSPAHLRRATTPRQISGYDHAHERAVWIGNAVLGLCCKVAAVVALDQTPRQAKRFFYQRGAYLWSSSTYQASCVRAQGWDKALFLIPWPGTNGITQAEASPETQAECLESIVGEVFLTSMAQHGIDRAMQDAWQVFHTVVLCGPWGEGGHRLRDDLGRPLTQWRDALAVLRSRLQAHRPGPDRVWAHRLALVDPPEPGLLAAAAMREWEGQSLEFLGDGVLRVLQTLHLVQTMPNVERAKQSQARIAVERNIFLARRLVRLIGADSNGLSLKLRGAQLEVLETMAPAGTADPVLSFKEDLCAEGEGRSILADVLEALVGAVALQDDDGLESAQRTFARYVLPPADVVGECFGA